jgi:hypothetical protein
LHEPLHSLVPVGVVQADRVTARQRGELVRQLFRLRHAGTINEDRHHPDAVPAQSVRDLDPDEILRIAQPRSAVPVDHRGPLGADYDEDDPAAG